MKARDILRMAAGALLRIKLRSLLTISGVTIGIAAMVLLVSFGVQAERTVLDQFASQDAMSTITVASPRLSDELGPRRRGPGGGGMGSPGAIDNPKKSPPLDEAALEGFRKIPGVKAVYPNVFFFAWAVRGDEQPLCVCTSLSPTVTPAEAKSKLVAGSAFTADDARELLVTEYLAAQLGLEGETTILGQELVLRYAKRNRAAAPPDGAGSAGSGSGSGVGPAHPMALQWAEERFVVIGVVKGDAHLRTGASDLRGLQPNTLVLPEHHARRLYLEAENPQMLGRNRGAATGPEYMMASVVVDDPRPATIDRVREDIKGRQFFTWHVYEILAVLKIVFIVLNLFLGALGSIALVVASLQIVNTMLMSILERTREIGVMKAIGARNRDIRRLFVAESLIIGAAGAGGGVALAWTAGKAIEAGMRMWLAQTADAEVVNKMSLFALPGWLVAGAFAFGMGVSLMAALYPAHRAARIDPVLALRRD